MASKYKKGQLPYEFVAIPKEVLLSAEWHALPPNACKLAMALMGQYTGKNNGQLCPAFEAVQRSGFTSKRQADEAYKVAPWGVGVARALVVAAPRLTELKRQERAAMRALAKLCAEVRDEQRAPEAAEPLVLEMQP